MAQRVTTNLFDDLDGSVAQETVRFSVDGHEYQIDLNEENARQFRALLSTYIQVARRVGRYRSPVGTRRSSRVGSNGSGPSASEVREWAVGQGLEVSTRGRVSSEVVQKFQEFHAPQPETVG